MREDGKPERGPQPVTWHPLFPAIVAVWFGALFGLGALAVHVGLIERLAVASGIAQIVPAAAPPLGMTARILIAMILTMIGGVLGAAIGNLLARSKPSVRARRAEAAAARANADEPVEAEHARTFKAAPAKAGPSFIDISQLDLNSESRIAAAPTEHDAETEAEAARPAPAPAAKRMLDPASFPLPAEFPVPGGAAAQRLTSADLESLSHLELIERLALSLQKRREEAAQVELSTTDEPQPETGLAAADHPPAHDPVPQLRPAEEPHVPSYYPAALEARIARLAGASPTTPVAQGDIADKDHAEDAEPAEAGYGSLLRVARGPGAPALRPAPSSRPAATLRQDPEATERALREALSALQRMSGAA